METNIKKPNPLVNSNRLSYILYGWTYQIFNAGYNRQIEIDDVFEPLHEHSSAHLGDEFSKTWNTLLKQGRPSLFRTIVNNYKHRIIFNLSVTLFLECVMKMLQPIFLGKIVAYYMPYQTRITERCLYLSAAGLVVTVLIALIMTHPCAMSMAHLAMKYRVGCCALIYRKSLRLSKTVLNKTSVGEIVNLLSNDAGKLDVSTILLNYIIVAPIQLVIVSVILYIECGISALIGVVILLAMIPFQMWLGKKVSMLRTKSMKMTDKRLRLMNEIILGIHVIKMYTWEKPFNQFMDKIRRLEIKNIRYTSYIRGIVMSFPLFNTRLAMFASLLLYSISGNQITAEKFFVIVTFYTIVKQSLTTLFPQAITMFAEILVSFDRIQTFLLSEEIGQRGIKCDYDYGEELETFKENSFGSQDDEMKISFLGKENIQEIRIKWDHEEQNLSYESDSVKSEEGSASEEENPITMRNVSMNWINNHNDYILNSINLNVKQGSFVAIVGAVGSGKTSLFHTILKEVPYQSGLLRINGEISYASQEPWLFNRSIAENILFGNRKDEARFKNIIKICGLTKDILLLPHGEETIAGERGVILSGGQKTRINLARSIYRTADIYLLDDPFSALDMNVGREIFEDCILDFLGDKTRLLITHQPQYLHNADHIIMLDNGYIVGEGKYKDLIVGSPQFRNLVQSQTIDQISTVDAVESIENTEELPSSKPVQVEESRRMGTVGFGVFKSYFLASGSIFILISTLALIALSQLFASGTDIWISRWANMEENQTSVEYVRTINTTLQYDQINLVNMNELRQFYLIMYTVFVVMLLITIVSRSLIYFWMTMRSSITLHKNMFEAISHATMRFFWTNPSGRIMNRFSKDMGLIDELIPLVMMDVIQSFQQLVGIVIVVAMVNPWLMIPTAVIFIVFVFLRNYYVRTSRSLRRLEGTVRSPIYTHLSASLHGMTTIRAFRAEELAIDEYDQLQDEHSSLWFIILGTTRAFGLWLDSGCVIFIALVILNFLVFKQDNLSGNVGLAITQAIGLTGMIQWGVRQSTELENMMTSVERVLDYQEVESENPLKTEKDKHLNDWPNNGEIEFKNVSLRYSPKGSLVLHDISFKLKPKEKLGIVGRTGSGKTSIINALFRLAYVEGTIKIDRIDTSEIGLHALRCKISIIPQDPVLFSGNIRQNVDPLNEYGDEILWNALELVELKQDVSNLPQGLDYMIAEGGANFSVGQRQLFCLARAIVHKNQILVMDEATANIDPNTDQIIRKTIKDQFSHCTIITIAHRLQTIIDSDKILVMDEGKIAEFDNPYVLIQSGGHFADLVNKSDMFDSLNEIAKSNYLGSQLTAME